VQHRISQLYWAGLPRDPIPRAQVFPQADAIERVRTLLVRHSIARGAPYAVLQPGARSAAMRWPVEKFAEIARWLRDEQGITSVVNCAPREGTLAREVRDRLGAFAVVPYPLQLRDLIALIAGSSLFVGNDSGPAHLAAAAGRPSVVIYSSTNPVQWRPWQTEHRVVASGAEFRAIRGDKAIAVNEGRAIQSIGVDQVRAACEELFGAGCVGRTDRGSSGNATKQAGASSKGL
jgi:ADP-heptose:LPS heptosyltransferase